MLRATPGSNHGGTHDRMVLIMQEKVQVSVDWLTFSVKQTDPRAVISGYLGMDPDLFEVMGYGLMGYASVMRFNDISVCYDGIENDYFKGMGVCVSMSGNGCRTFETMSSLTFPGLTDKQGMASVAFPALFQHLAADPLSHVSRIDVACDDKEGYISMDMVIEKTLANDINSRMAKRQVVSSYDGKNQNGATVYIGAPSSDFRVRIYDKALEQGQEGHWVRVEMVMRGKNAGAFISELNNAESIGKLAAQVLNDKMSFIERDDTNISRCSVCSWWEKFVSEVTSVHLWARGAVTHTVDRLLDWLRTQVAPSLSIIKETMGLVPVLEMAHDAFGRLSDKQLALIRDYNHLYAPAIS